MALRQAAGYQNRKVKKGVIPRSKKMLRVIIRLN